MKKTEIKSVFDVDTSSKRFYVLDEVYRFLKTMNLEPYTLFKSLLKSKGGAIGFNFADLAILLKRKTRWGSFAGDYEFDFGEEAFMVCLTFTSGALRKTLSCKFRIAELKQLLKTCRDDDEDDCDDDDESGSAVSCWSSSGVKRKIVFAKKVLRYLQTKDTDQPVSVMSKSLGVSKQTVMDAVFLLEMLDVVESFEQMFGRETVRFVKLAKTKLVDNKKSGDVHKNVKCMN